MFRIQIFRVQPRSRFIQCFSRITFFRTSEHFRLSTMLAWRALYQFQLHGKRSRAIHPIYCVVYCLPTAGAFLAAGEFRAATECVGKAWAISTSKFSICRISFFRNLGDRRCVLTSERSFVGTSFLDACFFNGVRFCCDSSMNGDE